MTSKKAKDIKSAHQNYDSYKVRLLAAQAVFDVMENGAYANLVLDKVLRQSGMSAADKNMITEIVNGTVRMIKHLDWVLNLFLKKRLEKQNPWCRNVLRMSVYQILFMSRIPDYACVNDAVELTRRRTNQALAGLVNGVLRNIIRQQEITYPESAREYLSIYYSHPEWMVDMFLKDFGPEECKSILYYNNQSAPLAIRTNTLLTTREALLNELGQHGVVCRPGVTPWGIIMQSIPTAIEQLEPFKKGHFYIQNEGSMLAAAILSPQEGEKVYDLCCGVGGKTTHMAEFMLNRGCIKAFDIYKKKLQILRHNVERLGITNVEINCQDIMDIKEENRADRVLLDAPCSGLGVLNRRADSRWRKSPQEIKNLTRLQIGLLRKAAELVDSGGFLLYSTCSINKEENQDVVLAFLKEEPEFVLEGFKEQLDFMPLDNKDRQGAAQGMLTIIQGKYNTDGMFYALLRRKNL